MNKQQVIAIIFDFDDTLGPDSTSGLLNDCGIDVVQFWQEAARLHLEHWDPVTAYLYKMIQSSQLSMSTNPITKAKLGAWGQKAPLYPGVLEIFGDLKTRAKELSPDIRLEFYVISSGIEEVVRHSPIASNFTDIWGCDFTYDEEGGILFPKRQVSYTDKTRYIFHVRKGLIGAESRQKPFEVNRKYPSEEIRIPIDQMVFIGDGYTDIPCFALVGKEGGIPLAVCDTSDRERWGHAWGFMEENRVIHWATADYRKDSTLYVSIMMALETIAKKIIMRNRSYQG
jgi:hypothetical protein